MGAHWSTWSSSRTESGKLKRVMKTFDDCLLDELLMTVPTRCTLDNYMDRLPWVATSQPRPNDNPPRE